MYRFEGAKQAAKIQQLVILEINDFYRGQKGLKTEQFTEKYLRINYNHFGSKNSSQIGISVIYSLKKEACSENS